ncbi:MAG: glycoside hydrolase family protein [Candidatus Poseidoniales archaeon]|jgi:GH24 family phage-related lysozyme (muramidase)
MTYSTSDEGLELIKQFEGCELTSYVCPSGIYTIGYGHTGDVLPGQTITQAEADDLLKEDVKKFELGVDKYTNAALNQSQFDALVSFTYNVGIGAYRDSTLLRLLNGDDYEGAAGQFGRWINGSNGPLLGLVKRREAEEALFRKDGWPDEDGETVQSSVIATLVAKQDTVLKKEIAQSTDLEPYQKWYVAKGTEIDITWKGQEADGHIFITVPGKGQWFAYTEHWKGQGTQKEPPKANGERVLSARYFSQRDNYRDASRTCFSSSCAMLLEYIKPGTLPGETGDDIYVQKVFEIGDTTDAYVQVKALASYGVHSKFIQNGSLDTIRDQIDKGIPVPIGILHHGPASAPSGGGHWICVIGYDKTGFIVHDPWGEIDHASGQYISTDGKALHYSNNLISARWTVAHPNDGWCILTES